MRRNSATSMQVKHGLAGKRLAAVDNGRKHLVTRLSQHHQPLSVLSCANPLRHASHPHAIASELPVHHSAQAANSHLRRAKGRSTPCQRRHRIPGPARILAYDRGLRRAGSARSSLVRTPNSDRRSRNGNSASSRIVILFFLPAIARSRDSSGCSWQRRTAAAHHRDDRGAGTSCPGTPGITGRADQDFL